MPGSLPRRDVPLVLLDDGAWLRWQVERSRASDTAVSACGKEVSPVRFAGGGGYSATLAPSKGFGELVASVCKTPLLAPERVATLIEGGPDIAVLDVRRDDEYRTTSIPGAIVFPASSFATGSRLSSPTPKRSSSATPPAGNAASSAPGRSATSTSPIVSWPCAMAASAGHWLA